MIISALVEGIVEPEVLVVQILGEVDFGLRLVDDDLVLVRACRHINLLPSFLFFAQRPLANAHRDLMVIQVVAVLKRGELQLLLVVPDHGQEFPVRVARIYVFRGALLLKNLLLFGTTLFPIFLKPIDFFDNIRASSFYKFKLWLESQ